MPLADLTVSTDRLALILMARSDLSALVDGDLAAIGSAVGAEFPAGWMAEHGGLVGYRLGQIDRQPLDAPWLVRLIVRRDPAAIIGLINFHGRPDARGFVEVGYSLEPPFRGQGYAVEAVRGLFDWARRAHGIERFRASISPDNERSQNLVRKLGMTPVGSQWDDRDGLEVIWTVERWPATET